MVLITLLRCKEWPLHVSSCCCTICELSIPAALISLLILGRLLSDFSNGEERSFAPATIESALVTLNPVHLFAGSEANTNVTHALTTLNQTSAPAEGGIVPPLELFLLYNHLYSELLGDTGRAVMGQVGPMGRNVLPSNVLAVIPANSSRVRQLVNKTLANFRVVARAASALIEWARHQEHMPPRSIAPVDSLEAYLTSLVGLMRLNGLPVPPDVDPSSIAQTVHHGLTFGVPLMSSEQARGYHQLLSIVAKLTPPVIGEVYLESEAALADRVNSKQPVWAAIVFEDVPSSSVGAWRYKLRLNQSQVPNTAGRFDRYARGGYSNRFTGYYRSGFLSLQDGLNRAILSMAAEAGGDMGGGNGGTAAPAPPAYGLPYPRAAYSINGFVASLSAQLPLIVTFSLVVPMFGVVGTLVVEKEERLREQLLISGVPTRDYYLSSFLVNGGRFLVIAAVITFEICFVLTHTPPTLLLALLALFALSAMTFGIALTPFFKNARIGSIVVSVVFFMLLFVKNGLFPDAIENYSPASLGFASLLPPCAFALGVEHLATTEGAGQSVDWASAWDADHPFSVGRAMMMLVVDIVLYTILFWYADQTWPSEFGLRRPWYFPCLPSHWRGVGGTKPRRATPSTVPSISSTASDASTRIAPSDAPLAPAPLPSPPPSPPGMGIELLEEHASAGSEHVPLAVEPGPPIGARGVSVRGLRKVYGDGHVAVHSLDMDMHPDQITGLLGANGAGKTTTISMLTGLLPATTGEMRIDEMDVATMMSEIRKSLGVCPQPNTIFPALTPTQHFKLYASIKGLHGSALTAAVTKMLDCVQLTPRARTRAAALSGGQKRKVCLGNALIGGSTTLFLDEPTSGMDPHARRFTWELLRNQKAGRTLVLTTHFLDEAEVLSDRIAIMAHGALRVCGTASFLKAHFGIGYRMTVTKKEVGSYAGATSNETEVPIFCAPSEALMKLVHRHVPEASLLDESKRAIEVKLPDRGDDITTLTTLFSALDAQLEQLGCSEYGVKTTSLEDVFLKVSEINCEVSEPRRDEEDGIREVQRPHGTATGALVGMLTKKALVARRDWGFTGCQCLFPPLSMLLAILLLTGINFNPSHPPLTLVAEVAMPDRYGGSVPLLTTPNGTDRALTAFNLTGWAPRVLNQCNGVVACHESAFDESPTSLLDGLMGEKIGAGLPSWLPSWSSSPPPSPPMHSPSQACDAAFAGPVNCVNDALLTYTMEGSPAALVPWEWMTTLGFNSTSTHALPTLLASVYDARYRLATGGAGGIETIAQSLPAPRDESAVRDIATRTLRGFLAAIIILVPFAYTAAAPVVSLVRERASGSKQIQFVCGARVTSYWAAVWLWDLAALICVVVFLLLSLQTMPAFTGTAERTWATFLLLLLYGLNTMCLASLVSFRFKQYTGALITLVSFHLIVGFTFFVCAFIFPGVPALRPIAGTLRDYVFPLFPSFCLCYGMFVMSMQELILELVDLLDTVMHGNSTVGDALNAQNVSFDPTDALGKYGLPRSTSPFDITALGRLYLFLLVEAIVFASVTLAIQTFSASSSLRLSIDRLLNTVAGAPPDTLEPSPLEDEMVRAERVTVDNLTASGGTYPQVLIQHLRKQFGGAAGKLAVRDLCVRIEASEVFGFLGVNGAGKSTTFSMLTGERVPSSGNAYLQGKSILTEQSEIRQIVGYCPQHDALEGMLTCREHLQMYAKIKGVPRVEINRQVNELLDDLALSRFATKQAHQLSGGNKRKLCVAIAMIGKPGLMLLDEPSSGMDAGSMRFLWAVIKRRTAQCCTILTTHSMEECEALCTRIGVMVDGTLRCLGPLQSLKAKYGQGYRVALGLEPCADADAVLRFVQEAFEGTTLDELEPPRMVLNVPQAVGLARLFGKIDEMRSTLHVKDGSVTQTTLEQVFVRLAKNRRPIVTGSGDAASGTVESDLDETTRIVRIERDPGQKLGLDLNEDPSGVFIVRKVWEGYACSMTGQIFEGEVLVEVDGVPTSGLQFGKVLDLLRCSTGMVTILTFRVKREES